ncbi:MAG: hypothetical protein WKF84_08180 [Pyrinomonadaceae bacterium]
MIREAAISSGSLCATPFRSRAEHELKGSLLIEKLADEEKIEINEEQVNEEINMLAEARGETPDQVRAALTKAGAERSIADRLRVRRTIDFISRERTRYRKANGAKKKSPLRQRAVAAATRPSEKKTRHLLPNRRPLRRRLKPKAR